jgi:hypothetical protein
LVKGWLAVCSCGWESEPFHTSTAAAVAEGSVFCEECYQP